MAVTSCAAPVQPRRAHLSKSQSSFYSIFSSLPAQPLGRGNWQEGEAGRARQSRSQAGRAGPGGLRAAPGLDTECRHPPSRLGGPRGPLPPAPLTASPFTMPLPPSLPLRARRPPPPPPLTPLVFRHLLEYPPILHLGGGLAGLAGLLSLAAATPRHHRADPGRAHHGRRRRDGTGSLLPLMVCAAWWRGSWRPWALGPSRPGPASRASRHCRQPAASPRPHPRAMRPATYYIHSPRKVRRISYPFAHGRSALVAGKRTSRRG